LGNAVSEATRRKMVTYSKKGATASTVTP
jgi:hypothetical protein